MNKLYKALVFGGNISLSVLDTKELVNDAIKTHGLTDGAAEILGGMLTAAAYMAGCLKSERGAVSITVKSCDGSATVSVSGDSSGHIRGFIDGETLRGGTMTVVKEDGFFRPFNGTCELKSESVAENLMQYFQMSEQIDTAVIIDVRVDGGVCRSSGGVVMQVMPGATEEDIRDAEDKMQEIASGGISRGADAVMQNYFPELMKEGAVYLTFPEYKCNCSRKKTEGVILSLGRREAEDIIAERGKITVHCHYCNTDYEFAADDVEKLFSE